MMRTRDEIRATMNDVALTMKSLDWECTSNQESAFLNEISRVVDAKWAHFASDMWQNLLGLPITRKSTVRVTLL